MKLPKILYTISHILSKHHAKAIVVGGSVRDHFLDVKIKDYDIEVYGLHHIETLEEILLVYGSVHLVGKSFGVLKFHHEGEIYDFSFPRTEQKIGKGHRGFMVLPNGELTFEQAAKRRDFTINAMGYEIETNCFLDPFGGRVDMEQKVLRHIDDETFVEDPLRVYRAVQFASRFEYLLSPDTLRLCQRMVKNKMLEELAQERIYDEWKKFLLKSSKPSRGFELMRQIGILHFFPELEAIIDVPQDSLWHLEGDVWTHTMMALDEMAKLTQHTSEKLKLKFLFAILCHDLGKAITTTIDSNGRIRSIGHEEAGVALSRDLMYRLTQEYDLIEAIVPLVEHHLKPSQFFQSNAKKSAIRRLATKVSIEDLVCVAKADFIGRTTPEALSGVYRAGEWLIEQAKALDVHLTPPKPLLLGRDLITLGMNPSPKFKEILDVIYELQLDGAIENKEEALEYVKIIFAK